MAPFLEERHLNRHMTTRHPTGGKRKLADVNNSSGDERDDAPRGEDGSAISENDESSSYVPIFNLRYSTSLKLIWRKETLVSKAIGRPLCLKMNMVKRSLNMYNCPNFSPSVCQRVASSWTVICSNWWLCGVSLLSRTSH